MDHNRINYYKNGVVVIDDFLPTDVYNEMVDIFHKGKYVEIAQTFEDRYELWKTDDKNFPSTDEVYTNHFWGSPEVSHN